MGRYKQLSKHFEIEVISNGVFTAIAVEGRGAVSNAGIVDMGDCALVFDTFNTQQAAADLKAAAEQFTGKSVRYVVNSHWHGDHIRGNQVFESSIIVSSSKTYEMMAERHPARIEQQKSMLPNLEADLKSIAEQIEQETDVLSIEKLKQRQSFLQEIFLSLPTLTLTLPQLTFDASLTIRGSSRTVQVISMGSAHTLCDSILYLPDEQIAYVADIVPIQNHPALMDGDPVNWLRVLGKLKMMNMKIIVPGHGPVGGVEAIDLMERYLQDLLSNVKKLIINDRNSEGISNLVMPEHCRVWKAESFFYQNLEFLAKQTEP